MTRYIFLPLLLWLSLVGPAGAFECLHEVDSLIVEFRIPPFAESFSSAGGAAAQEHALEAYRSRFGATTSETGRLAPVDLVALRQLLYAARAAWSEANEDRCFVYLHEAQKLAARAVP